MIGASAAVSGMMAGSLRFIFQAGGPLAMFRTGDEAAYRVPAAPLPVALRDPQVVIFLVAWFGLNLLFGIGSTSFPGVEQAVAWQAHIGGFVAGLVLFALFDPVPPQTETDPTFGSESRERCIALAAPHPAFTFSILLLPRRRAERMMAARKASPQRDVTGSK